MLIALPNHLRPRREKIFGPAPEQPLDGNAKARIWAAAGAYNAANRQPANTKVRSPGPLCGCSECCLWRFHRADGGGRCFPAYENGYRLIDPLFRHRSRKSL